MYFLKFQTIWQPKVGVQKGGEIYQLLEFSLIFPPYIFTIIFNKPNAIRIKGLYQQGLIKNYTSKDWINISWNRMDGIIADFKMNYMEN